MSYLRLGKTRINYSSENIWDRLIVSQVIDSGCSYETPKLIRTVEDLELYFGNSYEDFDYHKELITGGATLYLYKPLKGEIIKGFNDYVDISGLEKFTILDPNYPVDTTEEDDDWFQPRRENDWFPGATEEDDDWFQPRRENDWFPDGETPAEPGEQDSEDWVWMSERELEEYRKTHIFTDVSELPKKGYFQGKRYIYPVLEDALFQDYVYSDTLEEYVKVNYLPQKIESFNYCSGKINRDTLRITNKYWKDSENKDLFTFCHPKYTSLSYIPSYPEVESSLRDQLCTNITSHESELKTDYYSLAYTLDFSKVEEIDLGDYLVLPDAENLEQGKIFVYKPKEFSNFEIYPVGDDEVGGATSNTIYFGMEEKTTLSLEQKVMRLIETLRTKGHFDGNNNEDGDWEVEDDSVFPIFKIWNKRGITADKQFFNIKGLKITPNLQLTHNIMSSLSEGYERMEFYSKTTGPGDEDITISIKKVDSYDPDRYRIEISRYDSYYEVFEGNLYIADDDDNDGRIDHLERIINSQSKLVECKVFKKGYRLVLDENSGELILKKGTYTRGIEDDGLREGTWKLRRAVRENYSITDYYLSLMEMKRELRIKEDFLIIPSLNEWIINLDQDLILDYTRTKNCQALLVNHGEDYENDFQEYNKDKDNRMVYFYEDLSVKGNKRPGYYVFIKGILDNTYTDPTSDIRYLSPVIDPYTDYLKVLKKYKCNYMVFNEHNYYYRNLFSHKGDNNYTLTILSRYCMSHVSRVVEREFTSFLSYVYSGDILNGMNTILDRIMRDNRIIHNLYIEYIEQDDVAQKLDVHLHLDIRESLEKDISLGVTLNFNYT